MPDKPKTKEQAGTVPVYFRGSALFFTHDGGTFEGEGVRGSFATTVGGAAVIVYVEGGGTYECRTEDIVAAVVEHHKKTAKP